MAPESCQEAEGAEKEALPVLVDRDPVSGHIGPPAGAPADPVAPARPQDTKCSSTRVVFSINLQLAPESLDPHTLRLLWGQRELEIQALRWAIQKPRNGRHYHILREVAGLPPERSSRSQEKFLQNQVQKLTLQLKEQKEQAQLEKARLEERLLQMRNMLQQMEAELQAFRKSCLLQLARSSWVGRILRSSTGSVEVVTAETLMDPSDLSESDQAPTAGESFRLEDVDWNSIAHQYPNLFTNIESNSDQKRPWAPPPPQLPPATLSDQRSSELCCRRREQRLKSVQWSSLPLVGNSSSGSTGSESSSCQLAACNCVQKVTGDHPQAPGCTSEQMEAQAWSLCEDSQAISEDLRKTHWGQQGKTVQVLESSEDPHPQEPRRCLSPTGSCLKIVAVSHRQRFVRILNQSLEETADLSGFVLRQLVRDFPVCMYRFPPGTLLAPQHHITVWGEAPGSTKQQPSSSFGREPVRFHSSRGCVTLLLNLQGEVLSEHQAPHCGAPVSKVFADNTNLSIDRFPLLEARPGADFVGQRLQPRPPRKGRAREARAGRQRSGTRVQLPSLSTSKLLRQREVSVRPEGAKTHLELLPAILEAKPGLDDGQARKECKVRVSADAGVPAAPAPSSSYRPRPRPGRLSGSAPSGVLEERGPRLSHGGAVGAEHRREQVRLPLPQLPAHHRGRGPAGVRPVGSGRPGDWLPPAVSVTAGQGRTGRKRRRPAMLAA
ncbi:lamin tail domain-containing protein 2 isoform X2 [Vicugna pacos]|uniref:Lamin tail domain-containing protein 2 isoform X2 n=1 Tax=Vicugna pacos TaxID=30538 RepID=A0ABM5E0Q6_VICPA